MEHSKKPIWKKSMLQTLNLDSIREYLSEIQDNYDECEYFEDNSVSRGEAGYYQEYKEQFSDLSDGAYNLLSAMRDYDITENWNDMTVALLGETHTVLGYDSVETDYFGMLSFCENWAQEEAMKRIERLTKRDMLLCFRKVMTTLVLFYDIKAAHDCLTSIVEELDNRAAMMGDGESPQRAWVE